VTTPSTRAATALEVQEDAFCEADFAGATTSVHHAQCLLGTRVEMIFAKAPFAGTVQGYEVFSDFGDRIQHLVVFDYGSAQDYAWSEVLAGAEAYIRVRAAPGANVPAIAVRPVAPKPNTPTAAEVTAEPPEPVALGAPASFASYPLRLFLGDAWVEGRVVDREVSLDGHRWRVELLDPRHGEGLWLTQQELIQHF